jgi:GntR family transcriptional regulator / MocR family aminotransferase
MQFDEASWIRLERRPQETLRGALERELRGAILDGSLRAGARLPSSRVLARTIGVSRGVASDAYGQLEAQGFIAIAPRSSPTVAAVERAIGGPARRDAEPPPRFDLIPTTPDVTLFPRRLFAAALADAARNAPAAALDYGDPAGLAELRHALADHLGLTRGVVTTPEQIIVTQGTAQAIDLILRVLRGRGLTSVAL